MKALIVTNCATLAYTETLKIIRPSWDVRGVNIITATKWLTTDINSNFIEFFDSADFLVTGFPDLRQPSKKTHVINIPGFSFRGLHPDVLLLPDAPPSVIDGRSRDYSRLAIAALSRLGVFLIGNVYEELGYLNLYESERTKTELKFRRYNIEISDLFETWRETGNFLYTHIHPKVFVLSDIMRRAITGSIISSSESDKVAGRLRTVRDELADSVIWPVFPEIGEVHNIKEPFIWRKGKGGNFEEMSLDVFLSRTFTQLRRHNNLTPELVPDYEGVIMAFSKKKKTSRRAATKETAASTKSAAPKTDEPAAVVSSSKPDAPTIQPTPAAQGIAEEPKASAAERAAGALEALAGSLKSAEGFYFAPSRADAGKIGRLRKLASAELDDTASDNPLLKLAGGDPSARSSGVTDGFSIRVPDAFEHDASQHTVRVRVLARSADAAPTRIAIAYSTAEVGNSGWQWREVGPTWGICELVWQVPKMINGDGDYIGLLPDKPGAPGVDIHSVSATVRRSESYSSGLARSATIERSVTDPAPAISSDRF